VARSETGHSGATPRVASRQPALRRLSWKEQRELAELEARIEALETQKASLQSEVNASGDDYLRLAELAEQLRQLEAAADAATERWLELAELANGDA
jgi:ATP-binding cassette subfamily F protein uup